MVDTDDTSINKEQQEATVTIVCFTLALVLESLIIVVRRSYQFLPVTAGQIA